jgi:hypothetical protein
VRVTRWRAVSSAGAPWAWPSTSIAVLSSQGIASPSVLVAARQRQPSAIPRASDRIRRPRVSARGSQAESDDESDEPDDDSGDEDRDQDRDQDRDGEEGDEAEDTGEARTRRCID